MDCWNRTGRGWVRGFLRLPIDERWIAMQALGLHGLTTLLLGTCRFRTAYALLNRILPPGPPRPADPARRKVVESVLRHARVGRSCLPRALTLFFLARRWGWEPDLRVGVVAGALSFEAHAWVDLGATGSAQAEDTAVPTPFPAPLQDIL